MSLQFVWGRGGSGKSSWLFRKISKQAGEDSTRRFVVLVPEQFTLQTQKTLVQLGEGTGIMNIDVLSFNRLAYRVFEEIPGVKRTMLEDMGKIMLVQKVLSEQKNQLLYFKKGLHKPGFLDEMKSFLCELMLYQIREEEMEQMICLADTGSLMEYKLKDLQLIYREFKLKLGTEYITAEEILPQLSQVVSKVESLRGVTICLDGFTGFTPCQYELIEELLKVASKVYVTVTTDMSKRRDDLFFLSSETINKLTKIANRWGIPIEEPKVTGKGIEKAAYRFAPQSGLAYLEHHIFSYGSKPYEKSCEDIEIYAMKNPWREVDFVVRTIWDLVANQGYRYQEIAVVTGDITSYEDFFAKAFTAMNIRYFIDNKRGIGANGFSEFLLSFLDMIRKDMDYESTIRFLRCGLSPFPMEQVDQFENYILALGKRGYVSYQQEWEEPYNKRLVMDMEQINALRVELLGQVEAAQKIFGEGARTVEEYTKGLYELVVEHEIYARIQEKIKVFEEENQVLLAKEYAGVYPLMITLFEQMVDLLGNEVVTFAGFRDLLSAGISEGLVGFLPPKMDQVVVGDVKRSRLNDVKVLFFIGVNDGIIPGSLKSPGVLSVREREMLADNQMPLSKSNREQIFTDQFYMYLTLTKPSDRLILSYSKMSNGGESRRPSYLIGKVKRLFPGLKEKDEERDKLGGLAYLGTDKGKRYFLTQLAEGDYERKESQWWELYRYYYENDRKRLLEDYLVNIQGVRTNTKLSKEAIDLLYGECIRGSVTRLENFAKCPFAHFATYGLGLVERAEYAIGMPDFGNIFHQALEVFSAQLVAENKSWREIAPDQVGPMVGGLVEQVVSEYKGSMFHQSMRSTYMVKRIQRMMKRTILTVSEQMRRGQFEQKGYEISFQAMEHLKETRVELAHNKFMDLHGRIDRIDTYETPEQIFVRVVDYKTGSTSFDITSLYYGLQMQLVVYLEAAIGLERISTKKEVVPAGMYYYHIEDPMLEGMPKDEQTRQEKILSSLALDGYTNDEAVVMEGQDGTIASDGSVLPSATSAVVGVKTNKDGSFSKGSKVATPEQLQGLIEKTRENMKQFGNEIFEGNKEDRPFQLGDRVGCDYCKYEGVCGFDKRLPGCEYRKLEKKGAEEIWEEIPWEK